MYWFCNVVLCVISSLAIISLRKRALLIVYFHLHGTKLEDLKVLKRSPNLLNNVKIGQLIMEKILFYHIWGLQTFRSSDLNNLMNNSSNSPVISEKQMFR